MTWSPCFSVVTPGPAFDDDAGALVAEDGGEQALGIGAGERELVGVADAGGLDLDQHLAGFRPVELDRLDDERLARLVGYRGAHAHSLSPQLSAVALARASQSLTSMRGNSKRSVVRAYQPRPCMRPTRSQLGRVDIAALGVEHAIVAHMHGQDAADHDHPVCRRCRRW